MFGLGRDEKGCKMDVKSAVASTGERSTFIKLKVVFLNSEITSYKH